MTINRRWLFQVSKFYVTFTKQQITDARIEVHLSVSFMGLGLHKTNAKAFDTFKNKAIMETQPYLMTMLFALSKTHGGCLKKKRC